MKPVVLFRDLGSIDYQSAWDIQEKIHAEAVALKLASRNSGEIILPENHLLFCEHPHVYTLGRSGSEMNLLISRQELESRKVTFIKTNRGGDITYHGPGQIVGYPILDLEQFDLSLRKYIELIEEMVIQMLAELSIAAGRLPSATGVWLEPDTKRARKICAIGVRASRSVTMHGFALNVNTDLNYFSLINPCGFTDKPVTSIQKETGRTMDPGDFKERLLSSFVKVFNVTLRNI